MQNGRETEDNTILRHHQLRFAACLLATCEQLSDIASNDDTSLLVSFVTDLPPHTISGSDCGVSVVIGPCFQLSL